MSDPNSFFPWTQTMDTDGSEVVIQEVQSWGSAPHPNLVTIQLAQNDTIIDISQQTLETIGIEGIQVLPPAQFVDLDVAHQQQQQQHIQDIPNILELQVVHEVLPINVEEEGDKKVNPKQKPKRIYPSKDEPVKCPICQLQLKNQKNLRSHMSTHGGEKKFHCPDCPKRFLRSNQLKSHQKVHTNERPYECNICFKTFSQSSNFFVHKNTHLDTPVDATLPFKCDICQRTFSQQIYLRTHMKVHSERDPMRCKLCRRKYDSQMDLEQHTKEHVAINLFRCLECGKEFKCYINLKNHRFMHNGLKPYPCKVCGKSFAHTTSLAVHVRTHTGEKPYKCPQCYSAFSQWANYHRHVTTHNKKKYQATVRSEKTYSPKSTTRTHEKNRKPHECKACGKGFKRIAGLERHLETHLVACLLCGAEMDNEKEYLEHQQLEHRSSKLKCDICHEKFWTLRQIRMHMEQSHVSNDEKLYKCDECDIFENEFALDVHVRQAHPAYRMHGCPNCRLDFAHTELLVLHMKEHLGQKQCEQCGKVFRKYGLYKRHQCVRAKYIREIRERDAEEERRILLATGKSTEKNGHVGESDEESITPKTIENKNCQIEESPSVKVEFSVNGPDSILTETTEFDHSAVSIRENYSTPLSVERLTESLKYPSSVIELIKNEAELNIVDDENHFESETKFEDPIKEKDLYVGQGTGVNSYDEHEDEIDDLTFEGFDDSDEDPDFQPDTDNFAAGLLTDSDSQSFPETKPDPSETEPNSEPDESVMCAVCGRSFPSAKRLQIHSLSHGERKFQCDKCAMSFLRSSELITHMRSHNGERPFQCEICSKCFTQSSALYTHHRVHTGERPFSCKICQKRFKQSSARKRHEALHTGEKPFMCVVCGKSFSNSDGLQTHAKVHEKVREPRVKMRAVRPPKPIRVKPTKPEPVLGPNGYFGDLPYPCEVCRKTFAKACTLWVHSKIHTGEKNFTCDQCPKAFAQAANLKRHKMSHTGKRPYQCFECTKWFAKKETLDAHMELHADENRTKAVTVIQVQGIPDVSAILKAKPAEEQV